MDQVDMGLIGLAVMGQNLALNIADHGYKIAVFNRTQEKTQKFCQKNNSENLKPTYSLEEFVKSLQSPKKILMMIKAGPAVDEMIQQLLPHLDKGDILVDGGNAHYNDTVRRYRFLQEKGIDYMGVGISGGELGARQGPSIMAGGSEKGWESLQKMFMTIAAKAHDYVPCAAWMGAEGAGHFVKMVHNGIEYADMQLIAESYDLMKRGLQLSDEAIGEIFHQWNQGKNQSYLIEITAQILSTKENDIPLIEKIVDVAAQKGTGRWTAEAALEHNVPLSVLTNAVYARYISALKEEREKASATLLGPFPEYTGDKKYFVAQLEKALYGAKIIAYAQGFALIQKMSDQKKWNIPLGDVALIWREGCIIRSRFLEDINRAFVHNANMPNLLLDSFFTQEIELTQAALRLVIQQGISMGIPLLCFTSSLGYLDAYRSSHLPANLIQAQRDFFGAHTFERVDAPRGEFFHYDWAHLE